MAKAKDKSVPLSGNVYCDWNAFSFIRPAPERLERGDLIVWSWSGDSKKPSSKSNAGLFRVSIWDGKKRRVLKVKHTRVHGLLRFTSDREREQKLGSLVRILRELAGRKAEPAVGGLEVTPLPEAEIPPTPAPPPAKEPVMAASSGPTDAVRRPVQGELF